MRLPRRRLAAGLLVLAAGLGVAGLVTEALNRSSEPVVGASLPFPSASGPGRDPQSSVISGDERTPGGAQGRAGGGELEEAPVTTPSAVPRPGSLPGTAPAAREPKPGAQVSFVPVSAELPSGRRAAVDPAGVDRTGALKVPDDVGRLGWWTGGAQAGDPYGGVVLAGHVDSRIEGIGVLAEITRLHAGQRIVLTGADGRKLHYRVQRLERIPKAGLSADSDLFAQDGPARLVMITCGGPFDAATHRYRDNVILLARPVRG